MNTDFEKLARKNFDERFCDNNVKFDWFPIDFEGKKEFLFEENDDVYLFLMIFKLIFIY